MAISLGSVSRAAGCAFLFALTFAATHPAIAQTETILYNFCSRANCADGTSPNGDLITDTKGNLYGTAKYGGSNTCPNGCGTVFALSPSGALKVLHSFTINGVAGYNPDGGLIMDRSGNLYGTTRTGGKYGSGTVFKLTPKGVLQSIHTFNPNGKDGANPIGALIMDSKGNLYGETSGGGANICYPNLTPSCGTVFEIGANGAEKILHSFGKGTDGFYPAGGLVMDRAGNLYGTTPSGGNGECLTGSLGGCGTVFKVIPSGAETVLHSFSFGPGSSDGFGPAPGLVIDKNGNLYGTTFQGGADLSGCASVGSPASGCGMVFRLTSKGLETLLYSFQSNGTDGTNPNSSPIMDSSGNLYGTTFYGGTGSCPNGSPGCGTVFELSSNGTETVLHSFADNNSDGFSPSGRLLGANLSLYGTTTNGGTHGNGVVFKVTP